MPKPTLREQLADLERDFKLEQEGNNSLRAQVEYHKLEEARYRRMYNDACSELRWHKRVIESLIVPDDNKRAF